ncbi:hypothetical protein RHMOL_Rhmol06G0151400 [Rhododendron molle]|uniref:Uncharacterized protein n=1 Tax=Rhododendron molle TaxID=49168 RepID=A0ACC0NEJ5_RHOML|nr:hypothetical protein RHMOL_Rhmol06G0151400 [Rhododendron molle]
MLKRTRENPSTVTPSTSTKMNDLNGSSRSETSVIWVLLESRLGFYSNRNCPRILRCPNFLSRKWPEIIKAQTTKVMQNKVEMARKGMAFPFSSLCFPFTSARSFITLAGAAPPGLCQRLVLLIFFCTSSPTKGYSWLIKSRLSSSLPPLLSSFHYEAKPDPNSLPPIEGFPITESEVRWAETKAKIRRLWS